MKSVGRSSSRWPVQRSTAGPAVVSTDLGGCWSRAAPTAIHPKRSSPSVSVTFDRIISIVESPYFREPRHCGDRLRARNMTITALLPANKFNVCRASETVSPWRCSEEFPLQFCSGARFSKNLRKNLGRS